MSGDTLSPDTLARALGLGPYEELVRGKAPDRLEIELVFLKKFCSLSFKERYECLHHFAAHYLSDLVHKWRQSSSDDILSAARRIVLSLISLDPIFGSFLRSGNHESQGMAVVQAERLCVNYEGCSSLPDGLRDECQFLWTVIVWEDVDAPLPLEIVARLCPRLEMWIEKFNVDAAEHVLSALRKETRAAEMQRRDLFFFYLKRLSCAWPSCSALPLLGFQGWETCKGCWMASYCSRDHQSAHWSDHKYGCCQPAWFATCEGQDIKGSYACSNVHWTEKEE